MSARLRGMREDEFPAFVVRAQAAYEQDLSRNGGMSPDAARSKATEDFERLFRRGFASGVELRVVEDASGRPVGYVVYAGQEQYGERFAFLYDIEIDREHRGSGHGRAAMELLEAEVRERGYGRLQLNVFGGNEPARALYRSLGFEELSVQMGKDLA